MLIWAKKKRLICKHYNKIFWIWIRFCLASNFAGGGSPAERGAQGHDQRRGSVLRGVSTGQSSLSVVWQVPASQTTILQQVMQEHSFRVTCFIYSWETSIVTACSYCGVVQQNYLIQSWCWKIFECILCQCCMDNEWLAPGPDLRVSGSYDLHYFSAPTPS